MLQQVRAPPSLVSGNEQVLYSVRYLNREVPLPNLCRPNKLQREKIDSGPQESVVLSDGHRMPLLGLGTATANDEQAEAAVKYAIKVGYR